MYSVLYLLIHAVLSYFSSYKMSKHDFSLQVNIFNNSLESSHTLFYVPLKLLVIPEVGEQSFEPVKGTGSR